MITQPFTHLRQFHNLLDVHFLTREDAVSSDADIARCTKQRNIASLKQMHGNVALRIIAPSSRMMEADALATDTKGLTLTIRFADCQAAVIFHPRDRIVCLVHAGWRGVRAKVISHAYDVLRAEWNIHPAETFVGLVPSLCTDCSDFTDPAAEAPELKEFFHDRCIDLRSALDDELHGIGVPRDRILRLPDCTRCRPDLYRTYRGGDREKVQQGFVNCLAVTLR